MQKIEVGKTAFPDQPPGLTLPITPDWVEITAAEAAGALSADRPRRPSAAARAGRLQDADRWT